MLYREVSSYIVCETLRRAAQRGRCERWLDKFNAMFWKLCGL